MAVRVAEEWLNICGGCEVTILDIGEPLLALLPSLEFVHIPVLMDHKYFGQTGEKEQLEIPEADVGIISGGIRNEKEKHLALEMREKCKILVALGSCACFGGVPAMANMWKVDELYDKVFRGSSTTETADTPNESVPALLDRVYALDEVIQVDLQIPGCPTSPDWVAEALTCLLNDKPFALPEKSVCDECPVKREEKAADGRIKISLIPNVAAICAAGIDPVYAEPLFNRQHWFTLSRLLSVQGSHHPAAKLLVPQGFE